MLTSKTTLPGWKGPPQTRPSVCLPLPFAEMPTKLLSNEPVEPEYFSSYLNQAKATLSYFVVSVVGATVFATEKVYTCPS
jgi:hypothetical protein